MKENISKTFSISLVIIILMVMVGISPAQKSSVDSGYLKVDGGSLY